MDREILFREKHIHAIPGNEHLNGTWVHGYLSDKNYINDKRGKTIVEIADRINVSERTVDRHIAKVKLKIKKLEAF